MNRTTSLILSLSLVSAGCNLDPPAMPEDDVQRRRAAQQKGRKAVQRQTALQSAADGAKAQREAASAAAKAGEDERQANYVRFKTAETEAAKYLTMLDDANRIATKCDAEQERLVEVHRYLEKHQSEPRRDAAITALEKCRKKAARESERLHRGVQADMRKEHAIAIEELFDENNPYRKGALVAQVKGSSLEIRLKGTFEGRARHSQSQVESWCEETSLFDTIVLHNAHGTFKCHPPRSPQDTLYDLMEEEGVLSPWSPPISGESPTPQVPASVPPAQMQDSEGEVNAGDEAALAEAVAEAAKARAVIRRIDSAQADREAEWRNGQQEVASRATRAGVGLVIVGAVGTGLGLFMAFRRGQTKESLDSAERAGLPSDALEQKYDNQTVGMVAGLALGLPLVLAGAIALGVGKRRRDAVRERLGAALGGVTLRF